tara:strand:- start:396 stop:1139 length:744 start_codon:yes stop_codon:yes gene_type:complete
MRYFIGNWKMFGVPKSLNILKKISSFYARDNNRNKYRIIMTPPYTLISDFSKYFKNKSITIGSQNCYHKDFFSPDTAAISAYMLKSVGASHIIIGHSDNRSEGDTDQILKAKVQSALNNNLKIIFCIGENKKEKKTKKTSSVLKKQLLNVLEKKFDYKKFIIAYEPIWSIGTGILPTSKELKKTSLHIRKVLEGIYKKKTLPVLYGGSVDKHSVKMYKEISEIDGFLIGGASKSSKKFIDIIKNYYR